MFCPYPTTCMYDRFKLTGVHSCAMPKCPFALTAKSMLEREIRLLAGVKHQTPQQREALERLRRKCREEFGGDGKLTRHQEREGTQCPVSFAGILCRFPVSQISSSLPRMSRPSLSGCVTSAKQRWRKPNPYDKGLLTE